MQIKLIRVERGYKAMHDCERVGDVLYVSPGRIDVTDMRSGRVHHYDNMAGVALHFAGVNWRSVTGRSILDAANKTRKYIPYQVKVTKQRYTTV